MRFYLIDRITELQPGKLLRAYKNLALGEEYLADHFPGFPVMPGVMMLQTLVEAGSWLLRLSEEYAHSVIVLREVKNVKYGTFMDPGKQMQVWVEKIEGDDSTSTFKGKGEVAGQSTVSARFVLGRYNLRDRYASMAATDEELILDLRRHAKLLLAKGGTGNRYLMRLASGMKLKDQVALVTGGSRGIGRGIVQAFAAEGAKVGFVYRGNQAAADALVQEIAQVGGTALAIQADVIAPEAGQQCAERLEKEWGRLDILVNNAGIVRDDLFVRMEPEAWNCVLQTNLGGTFSFCKAVAYTFMRQRHGRIINVSSVAATHVNPGQTNYAASKGTSNAFTRALAVELASRGVTVNAIAPGFIETDMSQAVRNKAGDLIKKFIPMRRFGKPEDIARVAVFLASEDSAYITGQVLTVDGGLSLGAAGV